MPSAEVTATPSAGRNMIDSYFDGGFRIGGQAHDGSVIVTGNATIGWQVSDPDQITAASLAVISDSVEVLLIGMGRTFRLLQPALRAELKAMGLRADAMDTAAACRTYNLLVGEGRPVAAALIAR